MWKGREGGKPGNAKVKRLSRLSMSEGDVSDSEDTESDIRKSMSEDSLSRKERSWHSQKR